VGLAGAGAGTGTMALFSDSETSNNTVSAGTLNLTVGGGSGPVQFLLATGVVPGDSGSATLTVANAGSIPGYVDVRVNSMTSYENGLVGNESNADTTGGDPGAGNGELHDHLEVEAYFSNGDALWTGFDTVANRLQPGTVYDLDYQLAGGASDTFVVDWQLPAGTGNEAQSDSVEFALTFGLDQQTDVGF